jgi:hypothetical protein
MKKLIALSLLSIFMTTQVIADECAVIPDKGKEALAIVDPLGSQASSMDDLLEEKKDLKSTLFGCFTQTVFNTDPTAVFDNCGCKKAIKEHCSIKHGKVRASGGADKAWCMPFAPFL